MAWPRSPSQKVTPLGNGPGQLESYTQTVSETHHKSEDTTHAHVNVCPLGCQGPATPLTPAHSPRPRAPPPHPQAHGTPSSRNTTSWCAGLTPSSVTTPPPRPKKAGWCLPSSTPTALAPSLPPQAPVITLTPMLWKRPGNHRVSVPGRHPTVSRWSDLGPGMGSPPATAMELVPGQSGAWLPGSGQFQHLGLPPSLCRVVQPQEQRKVSTKASRTSFSLVQPQRSLETSRGLGSVGSWAGDSHAKQAAPSCCPTNQGPQGRQGPWEG